MERKTLPRWWLFTSITGCGVWPLWHYGVFQDIYHADVTQISMVIYGVFIITTILTGIIAMRTSRSIDRQYNRLTNNLIDLGWFLSETMMVLGLIGTVAGMIYLFGQIFVDIDPNNPNDLKEALSHMASGLSTAMYTTICGMVGALIAKCQLMNIDFDQPRSSGG